VDESGSEDSSGEDKPAKAKKGDKDTKEQERGEEIKLDDIDEWAWKSKGKAKDKKKVPKGGAKRGHDKQVEELTSKYHESRNKQKQAIIEKEQKKQEEFEKRKLAKQEE